MACCNSSPICCRFGPAASALDRAIVRLARVRNHRSRPGDSTGHGQFRFWIGQVLNLDATRHYTRGLIAFRLGGPRGRALGLTSAVVQQGVDCPLRLKTPSATSTASAAAWIFGWKS